MSLEAITRIFQRRAEFNESLFDAQRKAKFDTARKKAYLTSRRAGKTTCVLTDFVEQGIAKPGTHYAFICLTQPSAEGIAWPILQEINKRFGLGCSFQEAKLRMRMPTGSSIKLYGADRARWSSRLLGHKLAGCAIDEAAFYSIKMHDLIDEVIDPTLNDLQGQLIMMSTPGIIPNGLFYEVTAKDLPGWSVHKWSALDNPHMLRQTLAKITQLKKDNPEVESTPSFRRNYLGEWVTEYGDRVYRFQWTTDANKWGTYSKQPGDRYLCGLDIGWYDSTAFSVIAWNDNSSDVYEVESYREKEMALDKIASYLKMYCDSYKGLTIVGDPSHRQAFEELRRRYQLPIIEAHKEGKFDWIELINCDLDAGHIKICNIESSQHIEEMADLVWAKKADGSLIEANGLENGICDAFLYAYHEAYHYSHQRPEPLPQVNTKQFFDKQEESIIRRLERELKERGQDNVFF